MGNQLAREVDVLRAGGATHRLPHPAHAQIPIRRDARDYTRWSHARRGVGFRRAGARGGDRSGPASPLADQPGGVLHRRTAAQLHQDCAVPPWPSWDRRLFAVLARARRAHPAGCGVRPPRPVVLRIVQHSRSAVRVGKVSAMRHAVIVAFLGKLRDRFCEYQAPLPVEEKLERAAAIPGIEGVELIYPDECADSAGLQSALAHLKLEVSAVNVNLKGHPDFSRGALSHPDPGIRRMAVEYIRGAKDCASALGCPRVTCAPLADGYDYPF